MNFLNTQPNSMSLIKVQLSKYDNQSGQYKPFFNMEVTEQDIQKVKAMFEGPGARLSVGTFYKYTYELNGQQEIYSTSPALFDHLETVKDEFTNTFS